MTKLWALFSDRLEDVLSSVWFHFQVSPAADNQAGPANAVLNPCRYSTQRRRVRKNRLHLVKTSCPFGTERLQVRPFVNVNWPMLFGDLLKW